MKYFFECTKVCLLCVKVFLKRGKLFGEDVWCIGLSDKKAQEG